MPHLLQYHIFISHAWKYSEDYEQLVRLLDGASNFSYYDYSINRDKSLASKRVPDYQITSQLRLQIKNASVVLVLLGMYDVYHEWIQKEVDIALSMNKPVIGVVPWGQQRIPQEISNRCTATVHWNTSSIVKAIQNPYKA